MTVSASDVARELRQQLPGIGETKLHKLLYYCQGHHLAHFGAPLFTDNLRAFTNGPVVASLWLAGRYSDELPAPADLDNGQLNTVGYIASRYGRVATRELINLTRAERPWVEARQRRLSGGSDVLDPGVLATHFREIEAEDREDDDQLVDQDELARFLEGAAERRGSPARPDSIEELKARLAAQ